MKREAGVLRYFAVQALLSGAALIFGGVMLAAAAFAATGLGQAGEHRTRVAEFEAAGRRAAEAQRTVHSLDTTWAPYAAKILRVTTRVAEPTNDRDVIVGFGLRIVDQFSDETPAAVLEAVGWETGRDADFRARSTAFLSTLNDVNKQIATLAESLTVILDRPSMQYSVAEADRVRILLRAERRLENRWDAVRDAAQKVSQEAVAARDSLAHQLSAEQGASYFDVGLNP